MLNMSYENSDGPFLRDFTLMGFIFILYLHVMQIPHIWCNAQTRLDFLSVCERIQQGKQTQLLKVKMNYLTWVLINGPLAVLNITANAFYTFCMVRPLDGEKIKQPLKLLLSSLICSAIAYLLIIFGVFFSGLLTKSYKFTEIAIVASVLCLSTSINSTVWLNFFYYTHIVPAQRPLFMWIKKNIKSIIYCLWLADKFCTFLDLGAMFANFIPPGGFGLNSTSAVDPETPANFCMKCLEDFSVILVSIVKAHFYFCVCIMVISNGATLVYLYRHMRRMKGNAELHSCSRSTSQVRVTITGIVQGILYAYCVWWLTYMFFSQYFHLEQVSSYLHLTAISFYMSGTTVNLGAGQAVFRQRALDIWTRRAQWCKTPKVQQSEGQD